MYGQTIKKKNERKKHSSTARRIHIEILLKNSINQVIDLSYRIAEEFYLISQILGAMCVTV
jgi:hypothetical protein